MKAMINTQTMQLRAIVPDTTEIHINGDMVMMPTYSINDLNTQNAMILTFDATVLPGMTRDDVPCWKHYDWRFNPLTKEFVKLR